MKHKIGLILGLAGFLVLTGLYPAFAQEAAINAQEPVVGQTEPSGEPEIQWVWGEVISVDGYKSELVVRYLDYETDQEKEMAISADDKTAYENARSLSDIKPKDTLSIDYVVNAEGKNIAKNISVEQPETTPSPAGEEKSAAPNTEAVTTATPEALPGEQPEAAPEQ